METKFFVCSREGTCWDFTGISRFVILEKSARHWDFVRCLARCVKVKCLTVCVTSNLLVVSHVFIGRFLPGTEMNRRRYLGWVVSSDVYFRVWTGYLWYLHYLGRLLSGSFVVQAYCVLPDSMKIFDSRPGASCGDHGDDVSDDGEENFLMHESSW